MVLRDREEGGSFSERHIGADTADVKSMCEALGFTSLSEFVAKVVPCGIMSSRPLALASFPEPLTEEEALFRLREVADMNQCWRSYIGMGYASSFTPTVIARNIFENPGWYTQYTPYQPEISQGRLEALLNFQTLISELTGLPIANASLLDEGTACAEAMSLCLAVAKNENAKAFVVDQGVHSQSLAVVSTRAKALGVEVRVVDATKADFAGDVAGVLFSYPRSFGEIVDIRPAIQRATTAGATPVVVADPLALTMLVAPGSLGAEIVVGSAQRFGVPLGYGGPHAAFLACSDRLKRLVPGRIVGVSRDQRGRPALRLALQTREQHIRREKATSNICTAQVLLAVMAGMYAVYHGPKGLRRIARKVHERACIIATETTAAGLSPLAGSFFDTVAFKVNEQQRQAIQQRGIELRINMRFEPSADPVDISDSTDTIVSVTCDETMRDEDVADVVQVLTGKRFESRAKALPVSTLPAGLLRSGEFLTQKVFNTYHTETEFLRYVKKLEGRDLSLAQSMIPLGSCTMKLNATSEMVPVGWQEFAALHPFVPREQAKGYAVLFQDLECSLAEITGFAKVSLQPNAGSQGEYAGLLTIRAYHESRGEGHRTICLIPRSAHGTNPASAVMAGFRVVVVECDDNGNISQADLAAKIAEHKKDLAALMVTYPSTHGVFEEGLPAIAKLVHDAGGQVYLDGANLNALVGLVRPAELGMDVCHINLHKTFCIPHGGGGPGMGPIGVAQHLAPFLPGHPVVDIGVGDRAIGPVSAAPWGSASILPISWMYIAMMGASGLKLATEVAILNANYIAWRLRDAYPVVYRGASGFVAHECIIDLRRFKESAGVEVGDVARRLMDYGFHAPTVSWPVAGTLMIEPTESESKAELDRFCDALLAIREEIRAIEEGRFSREVNPVVCAPHTALDVATSEWDRPYPREQAAFPLPWVAESKFWPAVAKIDAAFGDRNLVCSCEPIESYL